MTRIKPILNVLPALGRRRAAFLILAIPLAYSFCQVPNDAHGQTTGAADRCDGAM